MSVRQANLPDHEALWRRDVERRLRALETAGRLTSASIGSGGLVVKDGGRIRMRAEDGAEYVLSPQATESMGQGGNIGFLYDPVPNDPVRFVYQVPDWAEKVSFLVLASGRIEDPGGGSRTVVTVEEETTYLDPEHGEVLNLDSDQMAYEVADGGERDFLLMSGGTVGGVAGRVATGEVVVTLSAVEEVNGTDPGGSFLFRALFIAERPWG